MKIVRFFSFLYFFLFISLILNSQQNCGDTLPLLDCPGSTTATCVGELVTLPPLSQASTLPKTEYIITHVGVLADDGLGDEVLGSTETITFDPSTYGLVPTDQFDVTSVSYDLATIQNLIDAIYDNFFLFNPCCAWVNFVIQDLCIDLMSAGINSGSDIQNIQDVLTLLDFFATVPGSTRSVAGLLASIDQVNNDASGLPAPCGGNLLPICYAAGTGPGVCRYELFPAGSCTVAASLVHFQGKQESQSIDLEWTTASEVNSQYFDIERSLDGTQFSTIGRVKANGTSQSKSNYSFTDFSPLKNQNIYRLVMVDQDGTVDHSNIIQVDFRLNTINQLEIFPNPVFDEMTLEIESPESQRAYYQIIHVNGQIVTENQILFEKGTNSINFNMSGTPKGVFIIKISGMDGKHWLNKFVKN